ncbi:MAG: type II toxin-antitoxin system VapC family toxin [Aequorivita sp.]|nr:type II toxin-antitoxin system VapC family toxin [Aequorivita sp.]
MAGSNNLVVDTNIILYAAVNNNAVAIELLAENNIFISDITEIELLGYHRLSEKELTILAEVLSNFTVVPISGKIKETAIQLRKSHALKTPDAIIAATAMELGYLLATADKKLHKIKNLKIIEFGAN